MSTSTVTSKGQITIPVEVRRAMGLATGSKVSFVRAEDGTYALMAATRSVQALRGTVAAPDRQVTLEDMDDAISAGALETVRE